MERTLGGLTEALGGMLHSCRVNISSSGVNDFTTSTPTVHMWFLTMSCTEIPFPASLMVQDMTSGTREEWRKWAIAVLVQKHLRTRPARFYLTLLYA